MARQPRHCPPGAFVHVFGRTIERRTLFVDDIDRRCFRDRLSRVADENDILWMAWAIMPNHFHLVARTGRTPLGSIMSSLLTSYALRFNHRHVRNGHLFQNRYRAVLCQDLRQVIQAMRYVHLNPVAARIATEPSEYRWCGHSELKPGTPASVLRRDRVAAALERDVGADLDAYMAGIGDGPIPDPTGLECEGDAPFPPPGGRPHLAATGLDAIPTHSREAAARCLADFESSRELPSGSLAGASRSADTVRLRWEFARLARFKFGLSMSQAARFLNRSPAALRQMNDLRSES